MTSHKLTRKLTHWFLLQQKYLMCSERKSFFRTFREWHHLQAYLGYDYKCNSFEGFPLIQVMIFLHVLKPWQLSLSPWLTLSKLHWKSTIRHIHCIGLLCITDSSFPIASTQTPFLIKRDSMEDRARHDS